MLSEFWRKYYFQPSTVYSSKLTIKCEKTIRKLSIIKKKKKKTKQNVNLYMPLHTKLPEMRFGKMKK